MKTKLLAGAFFSLMTIPCWSAYDAFQDKLQRPSTGKQDLDQATKTMPAGMQSTDIKDYRDKLNAVQTFAFKGGALPEGATLGAVDKDNPVSFHVQAPFGQLSKTAQAEVLTQMPEAKNVSTPLILTVALNETGGAHIDAVAVAPMSVKSSMSASVPKLSAPRAVAVAPNAAPAHVTVGSSFRASKTADASTTASAPRSVSKNSLEPAAAGSHMSLPDAAKFFVGKDAQSVQVLNNPMSVSQGAVTQAFLPLSSQESITVRQVRLDPGVIGFKVTVSMATSNVPASIVEALTNDMPEALSLISSEKNVSMDIAVMPDSSFKVVSVRPLNGAQPSSHPGVEPPADVRVALADLNAAAPAASKETPVSNAGFLKGTLLFAGALGVTPASIIFETPTADPKAVAIGSLAVVTHANTNAVLVEPVRLPSVGPAYLIQGRLENFSNTLQAEIGAHLQTSGNAGFVTGNPEMIVESKADAENGFDVLLIALAPTESSHSAALLWKAEPAASKETSDIAAVHAPSVRIVGIAPASRSLVKTAFGEKSDKISFDNTQAVPSVHFVAPDNSNLSLRWNAADREDQSSFIFVGKPLEFTDEIRNAVEAALSETPVKKGADVQVEFLVDQSKTAPEVKVVEAGPSPREIAQREASAMGLSSRDYLLVDIGSRFLIVIDRGQSILIPGSANVRLKSPAGNLVVVAHRRLSKNDTSVLLMLSRLAIKNNWANLVKLAGGDIDEAMEKAQREDNPASDQFLVRVIPNQPSSFIVRALDPSAAAFVKPRNAKP